jgi:hypothetical protein
VKESVDVFHLFRALSLSALLNESEEKYFQLVKFLVSKLLDPLKLVEYCPLIFSYLATSQGSNDRVFDLIHCWFKENNQEHLTILDIELSQPERKDADGKLLGSLMNMGRFEVITRAKQIANENLWQ